MEVEVTGVVDGGSVGIFGADEELLGCVVGNEVAVDGGAPSPPPVLPLRRAPPPEDGETEVEAPPCEFEKSMKREVNGWS